MFSRYISKHNAKRKVQKRHFLKDSHHPPFRCEIQKPCFLKPKVTMPSIRSKESIYTPSPQGWLGLLCNSKDFGKTRSNNVETKYNTHPLSCFLSSRCKHKNTYLYQGRLQINLARRYKMAKVCLVTSFAGILACCAKKYLRCPESMLLGIRNSLRVPRYFIGSVFSAFRDCSVITPRIEEYRKLNKPLALSVWI